jgi:hypothetical protein
MPSPHQMHQVHARLECTHHAGRGFLEHLVGNMIKQMTFELEVYDEVNMG